MPRLTPNLFIPVIGAGVLLVAGVVILATGGGSRSPDHSVSTALGVLDDRKLAEGEPAPDFALVSVRSSDEVIRLSSFRGKVVVVNFYASWCGPCRRELPDFESLANEFAAEVAFIAVNVQESRSSALRILEETGATFPAVLDSQGEVARRYGLRGMPSTYVLDATGVVRQMGPGAIDRETLKAEIQAALVPAD